MIKLTDNINRIDPSSPFGVRIGSLYKAYGNTDLCDFYVDTEASTVFAKFGDTLIMDGEEISDRIELKNFCVFSGVKTILCNGNIAFSALPQKEGYILKKHAYHKVCNCAQKVVLNGNLRDVYSLISRYVCRNTSNLKFDEFYVDLSHRIRHNCALSVIIYKDSKPVSCAVASFIFKGAAIITSVCTDSRYRKLGYAYAAVECLVANLNRIGVKDIYLHIEDKSLFEFYNQLGFSGIGIWREVEVDR